LYGLEKLPTAWLLGSISHALDCEVGRAALGLGRGRSNDVSIHCRKTRTYDVDRTEQIHFYEEMTREKRPQDVGRDGSQLKFTTLEHHGIDVCPEAIEIVDLKGRVATYRVTQSHARNERARDMLMDGSALRFETLEHGGQYPDDMPQLIKVTDPDGRTSRYKPISEDGSVVDSKGFELVPIGRALVSDG
jgi:hypothetical protein